MDLILLEENAVLHILDKFTHLYAGTISGSKGKCYGKSVHRIWLAYT